MNEAQMYEGEAGIDQRSPVQEGSADAELQKFREEKAPLSLPVRNG